MNHAPRCDCFDCLPGVPVERKPRVRVTRPDRRPPFKRGDGNVRKALRMLREKAGLAMVGNE